MSDTTTSPVCRASEYLDRTRADDPARIVIMDLLDAIDDQRRQIDIMKESAAQRGLIDRLNATGLWWMIGKGRAASFEPLWGCLITQPVVSGADIAREEGDDLASCVDRARAYYTCETHSDRLY